MRKKGFTLIELLAVIVVLGIIALISTPIVLTILDQVRKNSFKSSVQSILHAAELYEASDNQFVQIDHQGLPVNSFSFTNKQDYVGKVYRDASTNELIAHMVTNQEYCANGPMKDLVIQKGSCKDNDKTEAEGLEITSYVEMIHSIQISVRAYDEESGIYGYLYCIEKMGESSCSNDSDYTFSESNTYTYLDLMSGTGYRVYVKAENGNHVVTESPVMKDVKTKSIDMDAISCIYDHLTWETSKNVICSFPEGDYEYQYSIDKGNTFVPTTNPTTIEVTENNTTVIVQVNDHGDKVHKSYTVTKIDRTVPVVHIDGGGYHDVSNQEVVLTAIVDPSSTLSGYSYQWYKNGTAILGATGERYTVMPDDDVDTIDQYQVEVITGAKVAVRSDIYQVHLDTIKPDCTISFNGTLGLNQWYKSDVDVVLSTDNLAQYGLNTTGVQEYNQVSTLVQSVTRGTTYYAYVIDQAGNENSCSRTLKVDTVVPNISFAGIPDTIESGMNYAIPTSVSYGISGGDVVCTVDDSVVTSTRALTTGVNRIVCTATSGSGVTTEYQVQKTIMVTKPSCSFTLSGDVGENGWYKGKVVATLHVNHASSYGMATNNTAIYNGTDHLEVGNTNGTVFYGFVKDDSGNTATCKTKNIQVDTTMPTIDLNSVPTSIPYGSNYPLPSNVVYGTGGTTVCKVGDTTYSNTSNLPVGSHTISCTATSPSGLSTSVSKTVTVTKPSCTISLNGTMGNNGWYKGTLTATINVSNASSYGMSTSNSVSYNGTKSLSTNSANGVSYYGFVKDSAGNVATCQSATVKVDAIGATSISLDQVPATMPSGYRYPLPSGVTYGVSGGSTTCTVGGRIYTNTSSLNLGRQTITCTATSGSGIVKSVSKTITVENKAYTLGDVIYYDPEANVACKNYTASNSNIGVKKGCLKWYVIDDGNYDVTLLLDHDTSSSIYWGEYENNGADGEGIFPVIANEQLYKDTASWYYDASLPSYGDIHGITKSDSFEGQYTWLYQNTQSGYWTNSSEFYSQDDYRIWKVYASGALGSFNFLHDDSGIRPVITVAKSVLDSTKPSCAISLSGEQQGNSYLTTAKATLHVNNATSYGMSTSNSTTYNGVNTLDITTNGAIIYGYVKDNAGNVATCQSERVNIASYTGVSNGTYTPGSTITYGGIEWIVMENLSDSVLLVSKYNATTLALMDQVTSYSWGSSKVKTYLENNWLVNHRTIYNDSRRGGLLNMTYSDGHSSYTSLVRLLTKDEVQSRYTNASNTNFWTLTKASSNFDAYYSIPGGSITYTGYNSSNQTCYTGTSSSLAGITTSTNKLSTTTKTAIARATSTTAISSESYTKTDGVCKASYVVNKDPYDDECWVDGDCYTESIPYECPPCRPENTYPCNCDADGINCSACGGELVCSTCYRDEETCDDGYYESCTSYNTSYSASGTSMSRYTVSSNSTAMGVRPVIRVKKK